MKIALDYDGTFTVDPVFWLAFIHAAQRRNHTVKIVTMRYPFEPIDPVPCEVIYTGRKAKRAFWPEAHIWIDDMPELLFKDCLP